MAAISTEDSLLPMDDICSSGAREEAATSSDLGASVDSLKLKGIFSLLHPLNIVY